MYWISCHNLIQIPSRKKLKRISYQMWLISYHKHIGKTILSEKFNYILVYIIIIYDYISDIYIFIYVYSGKSQKCRRQKNRYQASTITPRHHNTQINVNQASKIRRQIVQSTLLGKVLFNTVTNRIENEYFFRCVHREWTGVRCHRTCLLNCPQAVVFHHSLTLALTIHNKRNTSQVYTRSVDSSTLVFSLSSHRYPCILFFSRAR